MPVKKKAKTKTSAKSVVAPKRGRGRPRKEISAAEVEELAAIGCTQEEISRVKRVSVATLHRNYADAYEKGFATMQMSLRRKQVSAVNGGNVVMMIWLGKQYLGQRDKFEVDWRREAAEKGLSPSEIFEQMVSTAMKQIHARGPDASG